MTKNCCKHFNGMQNSACRKGIEYASFGCNKNFRYPCLHLRSEPKDMPRATCIQCEFPTPAELAEQEAESRRAWANVAKAREAIIQYLNGKSGAGHIDCPICENGQLYFSRAECNGHIHAKCETPGCVCWME